MNRRVIASRSNEVIALSSCISLRVAGTGDMVTASNPSADASPLELGKKTGCILSSELGKCRFRGIGVCGSAEVKNSQEKAEAIAEVVCGEDTGQNRQQVPTVLARGCNGCDETAREV